MPVDNQSQRQVLSSFPEPLMEIGAGSTITFVNLTGADLLGYSPEELIGRSLSELLISQTSLGGLSDNVPILDLQSLNFLDRNGASLELPTLVFRQEAGPILLVFCRPRKELDEAKQGEAFFRTLVETSTDGLSVVDETGKIIYQNPTMALSLGYGRRNSASKNGFDFVHPDDLDRVSTNFSRLVSGSVKKMTEEFRLLASDGSVEYFESIATRPNRESFPGIIVSSRKVTQKRKLEDRLRAAHRMEAVGRLAGGIAHDFNNLLTVISASSDFLRQSLSEDDSRFEDVLHIQRAADRAASLTRELLAFSRRQIFKQEVLNLNKTIEEAMRMAHRLIGENIRIELRLDPQLRRVKADKAQMEQVLFNVVVNARDAMPEGGLLTIGTDNVILDSRSFKEQFEVKDGEYVAISISDTGIGMTEEIRRHLFEPFFTTKEAGKGTGLGLSSVYGIVKQSDGYIIVESTPNRGTTFRIYLPAAENPVAVGAAREQVFGSETLLLVEDENNVRRGMKRILERFGYRVVEAANGEEAIREAKKGCDEIALLITDVILPGMSGKAVADQVRLIVPGAQVLFCSGYADNEIVRHGVLDPDLHFLQKPFAPLELGRKVRQILDNIESPLCT